MATKRRPAGTHCRTRSAIAFPCSSARPISTAARRACSPTPFAQAYADYLRDWDEKGAPWEYWMERTEAARSSFAGLVGADNDEVAVTASVSAGVNAIASGLRLDDGRDRIVVSDFEFPTVGQIWHAQEDRGFTIRHVPQGDAPVVPLEAFDAAIDEKTALVAITQVCYRNGACIDVEGVVKLAHERGALVLLDSYQAIGTMPIDVKGAGRRPARRRRTQVPALSAGLGFLYCKRDLVERLRPTATGWFADENVFAMDIQDYSPAHDARRFQAGTPPIPSIYAGIAGIGLMQEIGIAETRAHVLAAQRDALRRRRRARRHGRHAARPRLARRARRHPLDGRARARRRARRGRPPDLLARRQSARLGALLQHARGHRAAARRPRAPPRAAHLSGPSVTPTRRSYPLA